MLINLRGVGHTGCFLVFSVIMLSFAKCPRAVASYFCTEMCVINLLSWHKKLNKGYFPTHGVFSYETSLKYSYSFILFCSNRMSECDISASLHLYHYLLPSDLLICICAFVWFDNVLSNNKKKCIKSRNVKICFINPSSEHGIIFF